MSEESLYNCPRLLGFCFKGIFILVLVGFLVGFSGVSVFGHMILSKFDRACTKTCSFLENITIDH